ncbi:aminotransferase class I/II-fold pyridoxal phosphate-dependent enzyme [Sediminibacillus albus]|uniref:Lysine decarboxylase n=1 Tax=Sediminibacillus albus TaxID=407036 RepID=A0A1G9D734_9BACI|nr:aminotransferase class I/II-fold pyridoxal phosphate-dependent enzyme [Sediminibacillus albus]SDK59663.1 lysine decarboxylase [Sediminibacillus albus]
MKYNQSQTPLFNALKNFSGSKPISFHVPGHKNGRIFPESGKGYYESLLNMDVTELTGLDDLHAAEGVISRAQRLAADLFSAESTFFLVGGSTAGNLAMILAAASHGSKMLVQRNSHKSILNGLELGGVEPVFVAPEYDSNVNRYHAPSLKTVKEAVSEHPTICAIVLTYPDYFGRTFALKEIIDFAHQKDIAVLVDEAHGVHFSLSKYFPLSALELGADIVVQSAHKMAPALTMSSFLHIKSKIIDREDVAYYLQMMQSSSPSYPLMASLDLARHYLANMPARLVDEIINSANSLREELAKEMSWKILEPEQGIDDPLKVTLEVPNGCSGRDVAKLFEAQNIYPELYTHDQVLFIHGLAPFQEWRMFKEAMKKISGQLKFLPNHGTIGSVRINQKPVQSLEITYQQMKKRNKQFLSWQLAEGNIAAQSVVPYPPGIPLILKGERITGNHIKVIKYLLKQGTNFQNQQVEQGIICFI